MHLKARALDRTSNLNSYSSPLKLDEILSSQGSIASGPTLLVPKLPKKESEVRLTPAQQALNDGLDKTFDDRFFSKR